MHSARKILWAFSLLITLLLGTGVSAFEVDDDIPEVTARVARISFIRGKVQIRRAGSQDWETAVLNLPVVEGDEVTTDPGGRVEIQFNSYTHLRVRENSYVKIVNLKDEGIAISLPNGTLALRITEFGKDRTYFEIDAPKSTIAVQAAGMYRVDAVSGQVRIAATDGGEARVYSDSSGFMLKNGRSSTMNTEGSLAGEWETADAARYVDEFDAWSLERDVAVAKLLKDAKYDTYYDRDIYGAEDLGKYGEWIHTRKYGYVWKPYQNAISQYSDWSPYRYGQWRWIPPYGWTWVNDEPWGWATYHHGRWIYDNGGWYWTPYGYFRNRRSWWSPALVVVSVLNNNICWYPLPYEYGYYNYNHHWSNNNNHHGGNWNGNGNPHPSPNPNASPAPTASPTPRLGPGSLTTREQRLAWQRTPPFQRVPPSAVVSVAAGEFGSDRRGYRTISPDGAKTVLARVDDPQESPPLLRTYTDIGRPGRETGMAGPTMAKRAAETRTGAGDRGSKGSIDTELQKARILGNRNPVPINPGPGEPENGQRPRRTGAVERPVIALPAESPVRRNEARETRERPRPVPTYVPTPEQNMEREREPVRQPRNEPSQQREERQREPVTQPRNDPPQRSEPAPKNDPLPQKESPPTKSEPPANTDRKNKDGN